MASEIDDVLYTGQIFTLAGSRNGRRGPGPTRSLPPPRTPPRRRHQPGRIPRGKLPPTDRASRARATPPRQSTATAHRRGAESAGANPGNFAGNLVARPPPRRAPRPRGRRVRAAGRRVRGAPAPGPRRTRRVAASWIRRADGIRARPRRPSRNGVGLRRTASGNLTAATARQHASASKVVGGSGAPRDRGQMEGLWRPRMSRTSVAACARSRRRRPRRVSRRPSARGRGRGRRGGRNGNVTRRRNETTRRRNETPHLCLRPPLAIPARVVGCKSGYSLATWQLVKGFARVRGGDCDGRGGGRAPVGGGSHFARRVAIARAPGRAKDSSRASSPTRFEVSTSENERIEVRTRNAREGEDDERGDDALEGGALRAVNARLHLTARYRSSVGTVAIVAAEADVAELDVKNRRTRTTRTEDPKLGREIRRRSLLRSLGRRIRRIRRSLLPA